MSDREEAEFILLHSCLNRNKELKGRDTIVKQGWPREERARVEVDKGPSLVGEDLFIMS